MMEVLKIIKIAGDVLSEKNKGSILEYTITDKYPDPAFDEHGYVKLSIRGKNKEGIEFDCKFVFPRSVARKKFND